MSGDAARRVRAPHHLLHAATGSGYCIERVLLITRERCVNRAGSQEPCAP
jgi:hypothetical protein